MAKYSQGKLTEKSFVAKICKEYGFTYQQYYSQPADFLMLLREMYVIDLKVKAQNQKI